METSTSQVAAASVGSSTRKTRTLRAERTNADKQLKAELLASLSESETSRAMKNTSVSEVEEQISAIPTTRQLRSLLKYASRPQLRLLEELRGSPAQLGQTCYLVPLLVLQLRGLTS